MNFLAHAFLSFGNSDILVGNMIADMVKGKQINDYPLSIQRGIHIHRQIDAFTDNHPATQYAANYLRPSVGKYAGAFLDVAYDHCLALDKQYEPKEGWNSFSQKSYKQIESYADILPSKFCSMFMYMRNEDWLYNYRYDWLIEKSFYRLKQRASFLQEEAPVFENFKAHYKEIDDSFKTFFPELLAYVKDITNKP